MLEVSVLQLQNHLMVGNVGCLHLRSKCSVPVKVLGSMSHYSETKTFRPPSAHEILDDSSGNPPEQRFEHGKIIYFHVCQGKNSLGKSDGT
jgi:hypothetical protein